MILMEPTILDDVYILGVETGPNGKLTSQYTYSGQVSKRLHTIMHKLINVCRYLRGHMYNNLENIIVFNLTYNSLTF